MSDTAMPNGGPAHMSESIVQAHSVFEQPWWLDAVAPGQWDAVEIEENGRLVARLPFVVKQKFGLRILSQPALTQTLGPWIEHTNDIPSKRLAREKELFAKLISRLPRHDIFQQNFHSNVTNWLPFYWQGFEQTTCYSYAIHDLSNLDGVLGRFSKTTRHQIKRAESELVVSGTEGIDDLARLADLTFRRQGLQLPYSRQLLHQIDEAVSKHAERRLFVATDPDGNQHSAVYIVGDGERTYSIVTGTDPSFRSSGAINLVYWVAIRAAADFTRVFDFEGSMIPGVEEHYRKFGGLQVPYSSVSRSTGIARAALLARRMLRR